MAAATEVQALLRFLTKDARIPLAEAMAKAPALRTQRLTTADAIAQADATELQAIFSDPKVLRQVVNAAKRASNPKKRSASQLDAAAAKRAKGEQPADDPAGDEEALLALPHTNLSIEDLAQIHIETNRAPLFLAFTVVVLAYTHPEQPLSSRLSLAQGVISISAQSRAKYLGLTTGPTAEEDGWAQGQPKLTIMGREIPVMRRHMTVHMAAHKTDATTAEGEGEDDARSQSVPATACWGLDIEALRRSNGPLIGGYDRRDRGGPPIHKPAAARNYLLKSMTRLDADDAGEPSAAKKAKTGAKSAAANKEGAAAMVLKAIDVVCQSWASSLNREELDKRAQSWYIQTRPDVEPGQAGWGQKGRLSLASILRLQKG